MITWNKESGDSMADAVATKKTKSIDMTTGPITKSIILFALPMFFGNIFQHLYNIVDTAIVGNVLGDDALAAVGAVSPLYNMVIGFASGFTNGFSVVLARKFGAGDEKKMKKTVVWSYVLTLIISLSLTILSMVFLRPILVALDTPAKIIDNSDKYLRIVLAFAVVTCAYNMLSALLRAIGNSMAPLYFLIISSIINGSLDYVFVKIFGFGIAGAAYATVIAQIISVMLCIIYIISKAKILAFNFKWLKFDGTLIKEMMTMGFSMGLMLVVVSIGSVALQGAVNSLDKEIIAAHTIARRIDDIFMWTIGTLGMASSTYAGQNYGAGKMDRVYKGLRNTIGVAMLWSVFSTAMLFIFGRNLIVLISGSHNSFVIETAYKYIRINVSFFVILSILIVLRNGLQGMGRKIVPVLGSVVELIFKFAAVGIITNKLGYFGVCILEPIIWCVCAMMVLADFLIFVKKSKQESGGI
ncbi:MAG: MATE family efflux transporter [Lachnospiraceae bacterium]|nr:MATE family efflux transporter [Lachnospiraceae bacterium]